MELVKIQRISGYPNQIGTIRERPKTVAQAAVKSGEWKYFNSPEIPQALQPRIIHVNSHDEKIPSIEEMQSGVTEEKKKRGRPKKNP